MEYSKQEINQAARELKANMDKVMQRCTNVKNYHIYVKRFVKLIEDNQVINDILGSFIDKEANVNDIIHSHPGKVWMDFKIHVDENYNASCILKILIKLGNMNNSSEVTNFLFYFYQSEKVTDIINKWNNNQVKACFITILGNIKKILVNLQNGDSHMDNIKDTVININANGSNIAIGNNNNQRNSVEDIFDNLINLTEKNIDSPKKEEIIKAIEELKLEKGKTTFKEKLTNFIATTAQFSTIFANSWKILSGINIGQK